MGQQDASASRLKAGDGGWHCRQKLTLNMMLMMLVLVLLLTMTRMMLLLMMLMMLEPSAEQAQGLHSH
jgi:hypothetical protein